jgi:isoprenylcysteine carboxyl methyltransferase (ICMT) family protein YpbQ
VIVCAIFFAIFRVVPTHSWQALGVRSPSATGIGLVILLGSQVSALWARFVLGEMWSLDAEVKKGHTLRTSVPTPLRGTPSTPGSWACS